MTVTPQTGWRASYPLFGSFVGDWHRWFAWKPVRTFDRQLVWLRVVERRCVQKHQYLHGGADFWFMYRVAAPSPSKERREGE